MVSRRTQWVQTDKKDTLPSERTQSGRDVLPNITLFQVWGVKGARVGPL